MKDECEEGRSKYERGREERTDERAKTEQRKERDKG